MNIFNEDTPEELILKTCYAMDISELGRLMQTSKRINRICSEVLDQKERELSKHVTSTWRKHLYNSSVGTLYNEVRLSFLPNRHVYVTFKDVDREPWPIKEVEPTAERHVGYSRIQTASVPLKYALRLIDELPSMGYTLV